MSRLSLTDPNCSIALASSAYSATILPRIGGMVSELSHEGHPLFHPYLMDIDESPKEIRGGNPLLFPIAGSLNNGISQELGTAIPHHGFAMYKPWVVENVSQNEAILSLRDDEETRKCFPRSFELRQAISLSPSGLRIELAVRNNSEYGMPISPGWHPYFQCPFDQKTGVETSLGSEVSQQLDDESEFDFGVKTPRSAKVEFAPPAGKRMCMSFSPEFAHLQFWSEPGRNFVCIEPFIGPPDTLNSERRILIPPGETKVLWLSIRVLS